MINYEYKETDNQEIIPEGEGWEYWSKRKTPEKEVAVWRRDKDKYGDSE